MVFEISFSEIAIIRGKDYDNPDGSSLKEDVEMISITKGSISCIKSYIPSLPKKLSFLNGTQLSNGDLVLNGRTFESGHGESARNDEVGDDEYLYYKLGSDQWTKIGTMKNVRRNHSSVWMDDCLLTTGGEEQQEEISKKRWKKISHHEEFSLKEGVKERKELPIVL